jgi:hypothetical protein
MTGVVLRGCAPFLSLPCGAKLFPVLGPQPFADALGEGVELFVPSLSGCALDGAVRVASQANCTAG